MILNAVHSLHSVAGKPRASGDDPISSARVSYGST